MVKSETTIRRELKAVKLAHDRLRHSDLFLGTDGSTYVFRQFQAIEATLKWVLGQINEEEPSRGRRGNHEWPRPSPASQRPLAYVLDKEGDDANAKAGLMERRKDTRRA